MTFSPSQVQVGTTPAPIWGARAPGTSILIYNPDASNTVSVGGQSGISVGASNTLPLGPGQSVSLDGGDAIYACAPTGTAATVVIPGGAAFFLGLTAGNGQLALASIRSPDYVEGVSGWQMTRSGNLQANSATIRNGEIISGTQLYYSTNPGELGTLIFSISATSGTDPYGNDYYIGAVSYNGSHITTLIEGRIELVNEPGGAGFGIGADFGGDLTIFPLTVTSGNILLQAPVTATSGTPASPTLITTDTWHVAALAGSWTATQDLEYSLTSDGMVQLSGELVIPSSPADPATITTITGTAYHPGRTEHLIALENGGTPYVGTPHVCEVSTSGVVTVYGTLTAGSTLRIFGRYPLGTT